MKQAKAGAEAEFSEESRRPPSEELSRRCLQEGSDATGAAVVRPRRLRFSPGKLAGQEERGANNDAFKKVNGARRLRRHWSTSRPRLSPLPHSLPGSPRRARRPAPTEGRPHAAPKPASDGQAHHRNHRRTSASATTTHPPPASAATQPRTRGATAGPNAPPPLAKQHGQARAATSGASVGTIAPPPP